MYVSQTVLSKQLCMTMCPLEDADISCSPNDSRHGVVDDWPVCVCVCVCCIRVGWWMGVCVRVCVCVCVCVCVVYGSIGRWIHGVGVDVRVCVCVPLIWERSLPVDGLQRCMMPGPTLVTRLP